MIVHNQVKDYRIGRYQVKISHIESCLPNRMDLINQMQAMEQNQIKCLKGGMDLN